MNGELTGADESRLDALIRVTHSWHSHHDPRKWLFQAPFSNGVWPEK
jgi:hypothetical protein